MRTERKRILKQLEEGNLTAEEAELQLAALDERAFGAAVQEEKKEQDQEPVVQELISAGKESESQRTGKTAKKKPVGPKVLQYMQQAFTKIKNADLDLNFGNHYTVDHIFQTDEPFRKVELKIYNGSLTIKSWNEPLARLETNAKVYSEEDEQAARKRFIDKAYFAVSDGKLQFSLQDKRIKPDITLYVPEAVYDECMIKTFNGTIRSESVNSVTMYCKTTNGNIDLQGGGGSIVSAETSNGSIKLKQVSARDLLCESVNGSLRLEGSFRKLDAQTFNGSIHCDWHNEDPDSAFFKATNGSIRLKSLAAIPLNGRITTNIGSLHCDLDEYIVIEEAKEVVKKALKFETHPAAHEKLHLEANTKTGSVWVLP
ncbi:DUF4097 family beta strand repeat-containing protein [Terribacillus halophilus]|uniref:DUF4097 family beta strand repeat-containing protein n=1 Tax=Terribacillus halophilus TaxID=361279 RepID=UPI000985B3AE|nr:DUF4097 domain-containing protein [Terribacillus halophilus]